MRTGRAQEYGSQGGNTAGQLWMAVVHPAVKSWLSDRGFVAGDILARRPLLDVIRDDAFQRDLHKAMHGAAQIDRAPLERLMKGFATLGGVKWTNELQAKARVISGDIARISPHIQRLAPDVWDTLHGSQGSVMTMTQAIAEAHRDRLSPEAAGDLAKQLHERLTANDTHALRGFDGNALGRIYREMRRQGQIGDATGPDEIHRRMLDYVKPLSAVRDALGTNDVDAAIDAYRGLPADSFNQGFDALESRIRQGDILGRRGGAFQAAAQAAGGLPLGTDLDQLAARDAVLREQAANSPAANVALAQQQAGGDPELLRAYLNQPHANRFAMTPEFIDGIRRQQMATDLQPRLNAAGPGAQEEVAAHAGYQNATEMQALHGPAAQGVKDMYAWGRQQAELAKQTSGIGMHGPATRMIDAAQHLYLERLMAVEDTNTELTKLRPMLPASLLK